MTTVAGRLTLSASPARAISGAVRDRARCPNDCERSSDYFAIAIRRGLRLMQTIILSCLFGAVCTMVLWVVGSAAAKRDLMIRRGGRLLPPEEF